ncbi:ABC transporter substrate-binding protein [Polycladidibacter hongkongensis]|uniref:ABC transporter substrate-binding protein n=1 Tax=Polycladidibacter hongkongensis TaxID=1647556 RepID=UPI00082F7373|nr:ABC transporter substrate-binding protein [Pseudovibrio hongkongensis]
MKFELHSLKTAHQIAFKAAVVSGLALATALPMTSLAQADVLKVAQGRDPQNLDPIDTFTLSWGSFGSNIFDGLVTRDEQIKLSPGLATSWEFLEEGKRIRFSLRKGVKFHNGEPFNADAVKFTFDRLLGEEGKAGPQRANYTSIGSVEVIDAHTVDFHMAKPDPVIITKLSGYGAMIVPPKYMAEVGPEAFDKKPVGTGPFKVASYTPGVDLKLERFDDYWNGTAKMEGVQVRFIAEPSTRMAEIMSGGIDISLNIPTTSIDALKQNDNVELHAVDGPRVNIFRLNPAKFITKDIRVRKAINMAIDKKMIVQALLSGYGTPINSAQGSKSFGFNPDLETYEYNPEKARQLLKEAGIKPGTEIALDYRSNRDLDREVGTVVASYLQAVGLNLKLRPHEASIYSSEIIYKGNTGEMFAFGWGGWTFDFDNTAYLLYHTGERFNPYIKDEKLDALLEAQRQTYDTEKRREGLQAVAKYAHEQAFEVPLFNIAALYAVGKHVEGFVAAPDDRLRFMNVSVKR